MCEYTLHESGISKGFQSSKNLVLARRDSIVAVATVVLRERRLQYLERIFPPAQVQLVIKAANDVLAVSDPPDCFALLFEVTGRWWAFSRVGAL